MRRIQSIASASILAITLSLAAAPSGSAATANGACSKAGQSAKIGGKNYVCAQNPTVKAKRLRWTLKDCLSANTAYLTSVKSLAETEASNAKILETIDASIKSLQAQVPLDKNRAVTEGENATRNRTLAADKGKEAEVKLAQAKAAGIADIPTSWTTQYQAAIIDRQITAAEISSLGRTWRLTTDQTVLAIQYLSLQLQINQYVRAAERYEKNVSTYLKTEQTLASVTSQRDTTVKTQQQLISLAQDDLKTNLRLRNTACRVR
jgi:hypothetical protein